LGEDQTAALVLGLRIPAIGGRAPASSLFGKALFSKDLSLKTFLKVQVRLEFPDGQKGQEHLFQR